MLCKELLAGTVFKYAGEDNPILRQTLFIKLNGRDNVVNVANWTAAVVDDDASVVIVADLKFHPLPGRIITPKSVGL